MLERILDYERDLFLFLNGSDSVFVDNFMWLYTGMIVWFPLALFILFVLCYKKDWRESVLILLGIGLVVLFCDQFSSHICKPYFERFRPTHHPDFMDQVKTVFDYRGGKYGFISGHAANSFGFAIYMSLLFRNRLFSFTIFCWAFLTAYTRIYLGVHFISDIIPGALSGLVLGYIAYQMYVFSRKKLISSEITTSALLYSENEKRSIVYALFLSVLLIILFNQPLVELLHR